MLTRRQSDLLAFIKRYSAEHGYAPSYDEMKVGIGIVSKSGIHRLVSGLRERGAITARANLARSVGLVEEPASARDIALLTQRLDLLARQVADQASQIEALAHGAPDARAA